MEQNQEFTVDRLGEFKSGTIMASPGLGEFLVDTDNLISPELGYRYKAEYQQAKFQLSPVSAPTFHRQVFDRATQNLHMRLGSDPEFFVRDREGKLLPAFKFLQSSSDTHSDFEPYWDGFQAEYRTNATSCTDLMTTKIGYGLYELSKKLPDGARITHESVVEIPQELLANSLDHHVQLGCMPSYNAYLMHGKRVDDGRTLPIRFAGGHLHFGIADRLQRSNHRDHEVVGAVKMLDATIGLAMTSLAQGWDDPRRREYYGLAGEFRQPAHGLEYRTLSNIWATHPALTNFVYDIGRIAVRLGVRGLRDTMDATDAEVVAAINQTDAKQARRLLERNRDVWERLLLAAYFNNNKITTKSWRAIKGGLDALRIDPTSITKNWQPREPEGWHTRWATQVLV